MSRWHNYVTECLAPETEKSECMPFSKRDPTLLSEPYKNTELSKLIYNFHQMNKTEIGKIMDYGFSVELPCSEITDLPESVYELASYGEDDDEWDLANGRDISEFEFNSCE